VFASLILGLVVMRLAAKPPSGGYTYGLNAPKSCPREPAG
jgi:hypothetical protein